MDEVDGMDRGGSTSLIALVKKTKVPIICICNDRQSEKVKSLANHCHDMKFRKLTVQQIEKRIGKIARDEGLQLDSNVLGQIVQGTQADVRQILNLLSTWKLKSDTMSYNETKSLLKTSEKNTHLTIFECIDQLLSVSSFRSKTFTEKMELYFTDFNMMSLMVAVFSKI
jgi:replication factor C subunit 1